MSNSPYTFKVKDNKIYIQYVSSQGVGWVFDKLSSEGSATLLGKVFTVTTGNNLGKLVSEPELEIAEFLIGTKDGQYFVINSIVLGTKNPLYIHESVVESINPEHFFIRQPYFDRKSGEGSTGGGGAFERYIPIIPKFEEVFVEPIRIGGDLEDSIPLEYFFKVLDIFPDREEVKRYIDTRISYILSEYVVPKRNFALYRDNLLKAREKRLTVADNVSLFDITRDYKLEIFKSALNELEDMLNNFDSYSENIWQEKIMDIILLLYPKYIHKEKGVKICTDNGYGFVDIMLFDSAGYVDLIEIKKPEVNGVGVLRNTVYRKNYVPSRELCGAIMQVEKYSFWLSRWGKKGEQELLKKYGLKLPNNIKIWIANPTGIIIFGRDSGFSDEERQDFEIIKRKYKHITDIITYDDLLNRLKNIISTLM